MACNGYNHPKDCKCNFRGGHPNSRPPTWRGWRPRAVRRFISGPNARCPECNMPVFYIRNPKGGGTYFDDCRPPWPKHACTDKSKIYSPYGRTGKPKLRNRKSEFERDRWLPFIVRNIEELASGTIIHGVALDDPTVLHFGTTELNLSLDLERPIYFRALARAADLIEFNFFPKESTGPTSRLLFDDCKNDLDLLLRKK